MSQRDASAAETSVAEPNRVPVLVEGRLHPASLLLRGVAVLPGLILPGVVLGVQAVRGELGSWQTMAVLAVMLLVFVLKASAPVLEYWRYRYRLTATELRVVHGVFRRQERRVPLRSIQDLAIEQDVLRRFFGVVTATIETASGQEPEVTMDAIAVGDAKHLRRLLRDVESPPAEHPAAVGPVFRARGVELLLRGVTDAGAALVIPGLLYGAYKIFDWSNLLEIELPTVPTLEPVLLVTIVSGVLVGSWIVGSILLALVNLVVYHGFVIHREDDVLQSRYGLLTRRAFSLSRRRVQCVRLEQTWMRRFVGLMAMRVDNAGSAADGAPQEASQSLFVPAGRPERVEALVAHMLPGVQVASLTWHRTSAAMVGRSVLRGFVLGAVLSVIGWFAVGWTSLWALLLVIPIAMSGLLEYRNLGYALFPDGIAVRWGKLSRNRAIIPFGALQAVERKRSVSERLRRIARLRFRVAGGSTVTLPNLPAHVAVSLMRDVARRAARQCRPL